ncbi:MAG TPA: phenylalanine--tRNA ligase subunit alpha [Lacipirellulaceae bacterium]|nr:phenylalanine--tRNA ligase subunit alpha [Lacipirellulaceae bacterium]
MPEEILLNEAAYAVWQTVKERGPIELGEVVKLRGIDQAQVSAAATEAAQQGFFKIEELELEEFVKNSDLPKKIEDRLPEYAAAKHLADVGEKLTMQEFVTWCNANSVAINEVLKWGRARGWLEKTKTNEGLVIVLTSTGKKALTQEYADADIELWYFDKPTIPLDKLPIKTEVRQRLQKLLSQRPELGKLKKRVERTLSLTQSGTHAFATYVREVKERNTLTPEDLESGAWREIKLRPYDVTLAARDIYPAKIHPLRKIIEQTRRAFLEMGFTEVASPMIESAFWNFDALFQPQDHPARDMQDTFYMRWPTEAPLPDSKVVEPVRRTHEDGWETGSEGWGYKWSPDRSKQVVLRTHTTAATIRALAANPNPPGKFFCVGWTYRNETISFKHLPVFHQVDGIIVDEEANLASLMGTLQEFYSKMGFGRVKFKPAFYPYTEPSVDVVVYMESRKKWLEMGGAGIFRPEVTLPLGCRWPVLAWGLGIERLAMLRFGLDDIRDLYGTNLDTLQQVPLCR